MPPAGGGRWSGKHGEIVVDVFEHVHEQHQPGLLHQGPKVLQRRHAGTEPWESGAWHAGSPRPRCRCRRSDNARRRCPTLAPVPQPTSITPDD